MTLLRMRQAQLQGFFDSLIDESRFWARNRIMRRALVELSEAWHALGAGASADLRRLYVDENPFPEAERDNLERAADGSSYSAVHAEYHFWLRSFLLHRSVHDVLLCDRDGNVVYSSLKQADFAGNLLEEPLRESGLGRAFRDVRDNAYPSYVAIRDFEPYGPAGGAAALFTASPVLADDGELLGVIAFRISSEPIDRMFREVGLRRTGKAFPVGPDRRLRSRTRFTESSTMLATTVDTIPVRRALAGETGQALALDYRGVRVLSSFGPLEVEGLRWAVLAEVDEDEYLEPVHALRNVALAAGGIAGTLCSGLLLLLLRTR